MPNQLPPLSGLSLHAAPTDMLAPNQGVTKPKRRIAPISKPAAQGSEPLNQFQTPIAVLMLGHVEGGPPNLSTWYRWATETGRAGTKIYINHKATGWAIPAQYAGVIVRLPPQFEVSNTAWGHSSLVDAELNLLLYAFNDGVAFSHFVFVSEDSVPLRRADAFSKDIALHANESRVVGTFHEDGTQLVNMRQARDQWLLDHQDDPEARNWWAQELEHNAAQFFTHSQWLALCRRDVALCVQNLGTLRTMARDYDLLFGVVPNDTSGGVPRVSDVVAADEIVIGTFLHMRGIRPSEKVLMAEESDPTGFHAGTHATVAALRDVVGQSSDSAMFGRKIPGRLQGDDVVTWM